MRGVELPFHPDLQVPTLTEVRLPVPRPEPLADVEAATRTAVTERLRGHVTPGMTVAVGAGSRGLTDRVALLRGTIDGLRALGAEPFVVPAMGSHGGAKAEGQAAMLASLGITEDSVGAEIRSTMETVEVARTAAGMSLYLDRHAAAADRIMPVNRIKPHTCFRGPIESGLTKMAVVGFGKQPGAAQIHACGPVEMRNRILDGIAALRATGRVLGGLGSIESASGEVASVHALTGDEVGAQPEIDLTDRARELVPPLPFPQIDVLVVEKGGKDISGTTMDPNVTGRFWVHGLDDRRDTRRQHHRAARHHPGLGRERAGNRLRRLHPVVGGHPHRLEEDLHQLLHGRSVGRATSPDADGPEGRGNLREGRALHVRTGGARTEAGRAHSVDPAPHHLLGQRRLARRGRPRGELTERPSNVRDASDR